MGQHCETNRVGIQKVESPNLLDNHILHIGSRKHPCHVVADWVSQPDVHVSLQSSAILKKHQHLEHMMILMRETSCNKLTWRFYTELRPKRVKTLLQATESETTKTENLPESSSSLTCCQTWESMLCQLDEGKITSRDLHEARRVIQFLVAKNFQVHCTTRAMPEHTVFGRVKAVSAVFLK